MFTLKQLSKGLAGHLKNQLLAGEWEFVSCDEYVAYLDIEKTIVQIWIANQPKNCQIYFNDDGFFTVIGEHLKFETEEESVKLFEMLEPHILDYREKERKERKARLLEIQKELEND